MRFCTRVCSKNLRTKLLDSSMVRPVFYVYYLTYATKLSVIAVFCVLVVGAVILWHLRQGAKTFDDENLALGTR